MSPSGDRNVAAVDVLNDRLGEALRGRALVRVQRPVAAASRASLTGASGQNYVGDHDGDNVTFPARGRWETGGRG